jgi:hypothetical protein
MAIEDPYGKPVQSEIPPPKAPLVESAPQPAEVKPKKKAKKR